MDVLCYTSKREFAAIQSMSVVNSDKALTVDFPEKQNDL